MEKYTEKSKLESLLAAASEAQFYTEDNFKTLNTIMREYWIIVKDLDTNTPGIFNNLATNGIIDLINRIKLTELVQTPKEKRNNYKDYWDYLTHSIETAISCIDNYLLKTPPVQELNT